VQKERAVCAQFTAVSGDGGWTPVAEAQYSLGGEAERTPLPRTRAGWFSVPSILGGLLLGGTAIAVGGDGSGGRGDHAAVPDARRPGRPDRAGRADDPHDADHPVDAEHARDPPHPDAEHADADPHAHATTPTTPTTPPPETPVVPTVTPEPGTVALVAAGGAALAVARRRRRR
jgi:hypothetical protein